MFEKLVVSTTQRRGARTAKFFVITSIIYVSVIGSAFALSIFMASPKLADTSTAADTPMLLIPLVSDGGRHTERHTPVSPRPDPYHVQSLDQITRNLDNTHPPAIQRTPLPATEISSFGDATMREGGLGLPGVPGLGGRDGNSIHPGIEPPRPDPPKPTAHQTETDNRPLRVTTTVLQGKAIDRRTPTYPPLARQINLQGVVSIEVMISPDGRVESARVVSGHPMLALCAREAAVGWRFAPTLLNGTPVRVTGVITFVFKLSD